jgi:hypothetical protein
VTYTSTDWLLDINFGRKFETEVVRATAAPTSASRLATSTGNNIEHFPVKEDNEDDGKHWSFKFPNSASQNYFDKQIRKFKSYIIS